jgi:hypothetical protein
MKCVEEDCPLWVPELQDIGGCSWFHTEPCHLTPAAMRIVKLLIEYGISDEDAAIVEQAIAGEGRLKLERPLCPVCHDTGFTSEYKTYPSGGSVSTKSCPRCRTGQDQGGE